MADRKIVLKDGMVVEDTLPFAPVPEAALDRGANG